MNLWGQPNFNVDEFFLKYLTKIENIFTKKQKQSTIQDFFVKDN
jgi:hypothetical protein